MKIAIVGQGAIGSLFAYYWQDSSPLVLVRNTHSNNKRAVPKTLLSLRHEPRQLKHKIQDIGHVKHAPLDALIITVKCYQVAEVIKSITPWLLPTTNIVLIQNGMGGASLIQQAFANNPLFIGTTTDAVFKVDDEHYQISALGRLDIGIATLTHKSQEQHSKQLDWLRRFSKAHPNVQIHDNIELALYRKLAINAVINPLTALLNIKNGELRNHLPEVGLIVAEVFAVYNALNLPFTIEEIEKSVMQVIESTKHNFSSMQQDVFYKRRTEIDAVLGFLLEHAKQHHINAPFMLKLYQDIKRLYQ